MTACESSVRTIALRAPPGVVDKVMAELEQTSVEDEVWGAKFTVMKENIEHHIEEEEGEMFPQARQVFDKEELRALGEQMAVRKEQALQDPSLAAQSK